MKKSILILSILATFSSTAFSSEEDTLPELPQAYQLSILESCEELASADDVENDMLADYLLDCMNNDLKELGYQPATELPVADTDE